MIVSRIGEIMWSMMTMINKKLIAYNNTMQMKGHSNMVRTSGVLIGLGFITSKLSFFLTEFRFIISIFI